MPSGVRGELQLPQPVLQPPVQRRVAFRLAVGDEEGARDADLHRIIAPAACLDGGPVPRDALRDIVRRRVLSEQKIEAAFGNVADRALAAGAHPDLRVRLLRRWRLDDDVVEPPVLAVMREALLRRPRLQQHLERFLEPRVGFLHRHVEAGEFVVAIAFADAEIEPPARQQVQRRRLLGQQHGIVPGQHDHRGAQPQRSRACAEPGQQVQRRRDLAEAGEMMFHDEGAVKAKRLGFDVVFDEVTKSLGAVELAAAAPRRGAAEQSKPHGAGSPVSWSRRLRVALACAKCHARRHGVRLVP